MTIRIALIALVAAMVITTQQTRPVWAGGSTVQPAGAALDIGER